MTYAGSLRLPRYGSGARYGASVSTITRSSGTIECGLANWRGVFEGDDARERDAEAQREELARRGGVAGEAVNHAAAARHSRLAHDFDEAMLGVAAVNHDWQFEFGGEREMRAQ